MWSDVSFTDPNGDCLELLLPNQCNFDYTTKLTHQTNDATEARLSIDTMINYFAPRAFNALGLGETCSFISASDNLPGAVAQLSISPNPVSAEFVISTDSDMLIRTVTIFDAQGRLVRFHDGFSTHAVTLTRGELSAGVYYAQVRFNEGLATQRLLSNDWINPMVSLPDASGKTKTILLNGPFLREGSVFSRSETVESRYPPGPGDGVGA